MSVSLERPDQRMTDAFGTLSAAADIIDSAFLGGMLVRPVRAPSGVVTDLICADVTRGAVKILGRCPEDWRGVVLSDFLHDRLGRDPRRIADAVLRAGRPADFHYVLQDDGRRQAGTAARARFAVHAGGLLVTWDQGGPEEDLKGRLVAAECRATLAEARLVDSVVVNPDPFALFDDDDRLVLCNEAWTEVFGLQDEDPVIGRGFEDLMNAADRGVVGERRTGAPRDDYIRWRREARLSLADDTFEMRLADGRTFSMRERATRDGGMVSVGSEVTEIIRQREVLHRALDSINIRLGLFDPDGRLVVWNRSFGNIIGSDLIQVGMTFEACSRINAAQTDAETLFRGRPISPDERLALHREGHRELEFERWYEDGSVSLMSEIRTPDGWTIVTGATITELKQKETVLRARVEELDAARAEAERHASDLAAVTSQLRVEKERAEAASRTKSRFLANMSHELRTPLNAILGFSEVLTLESFGPLGVPRYREYAEDIHSSGRHLLSLINDILDMAKVEAGKYSLMAEQVLLSDIVERSVRMVRGRATEAQLHLSVARIDPNLQLRLDPRAIKQVLINLLANAIKFTPESGSISVECHQEDDAVVLVVRDNGRGIDPEEIPRLLRPFEQAHTLEAHQSRGTGLGLPLSNALVELHGGTLSVESALGAGTSVRIRLPRG